MENKKWRAKQGRVGEKMVEKTILSGSSPILFDGQK